MYSSATSSQQHQQKMLLHSCDVWKTTGQSTIYCLHVVLRLSQKIENFIQNNSYHYGPYWIISVWKPNLTQKMCHGIFFL